MFKYTLAPWSDQILRQTELLTKYFHIKLIQSTAVKPVVTISYYTVNCTCSSMTKPLTEKTRKQVRQQYYSYNVTWHWYPCKTITELNKWNLKPCGNSAAKTL